MNSILSLLLLLAATPGCFYDPVSEALTLAAQQACIQEQDCVNANSRCVAISMVFRDTFLGCNLLGNDPDGKTGADNILCDPLYLAYDCLNAQATCIADCDQSLY